MTLAELVRDRLTRELRSVRGLLRHRLHDSLPLYFPPSTALEGSQANLREHLRGRILTELGCAEARTLTAGQMLTHLELSLPELVEDAVEDLRACIDELVKDPDIRDTVSHSKRLVAEWPFPWATQPGWVLLATLQRVDRTPAEELDAEWPRGADQLDVLQWAQDALGARPGVPLTRDAVRLTLQGMVGGVRLQRPDGRIVEITPIRLAVLRLEERAVRAARPKPLLNVPVDVTNTSVLTMSALAGVDVSDRKGVQLRLFNHPDPEEAGKQLGRRCEEVTGVAKRMVFKFDGAAKGQLRLDFANADEITPFKAIAQHYGMPYVRDLLGLYAIAWASGVSATGNFWWWPEEHLELVGRSTTRHSQRDVVQFLRDLDRSLLEVYYDDGGVIKGPVVNLLESDSVACLVHIHTGLYRGVKRDDGALGDRFWPFPLRLLQVRVKGSALPLLVPVLGSIWRAELGKAPVPVARITASLLADRLAIYTRSDRKVDTHVVEKLTTTLTYARNAGFIGRWYVDHGRLEDLSAVLVIEPGEEAISIINGRQSVFPAAVPASGDELQGWLQEARLSLREAGALLRIDFRALDRARKYGKRPIPYRVRRTLRNYLWGCQPSEDVPAENLEAVEA